MPVLEPDPISPKRLIRTLKQRTSTLLDDVEGEGGSAPVTTQSASLSAEKSNDAPEGSTVSLGSQDNLIDIQEEDEQELAEINQAKLESKYFWSAVAAGTLLLGAACVVMALSLGGDRRGGHRRRASIIRT
jgi:hypothetical protein